MRTMRTKTAPSVVSLCVAVALAAGAAGARLQAVPETAAPEPPAAPPAGAPTTPVFGETLEVELVTVPFYAVDRGGEPVYDLRPDEVELRLDGEPIAFDYFDRYGADEPVLVDRGAAEGGGERLLPPTTARHVFFLFDLAFSIPRGLQANKDAARKMLSDLPESDWLYLITFHSQTGFRQLLGPLVADAAGKERMSREIDALTPNIERVRKHADLTPIASANCKRCRFADNLWDAYVDTQKTEKASYQVEARKLADSLEYLAAFLRQLRGPKLMLFLSQGIDSHLYAEGIRGNTTVGGTRSTAWLGTGARFGPIRDSFEKPLQALGETGTMVLFVNALVGASGRYDEATRFDPDADAVLVNDLPTGETALQEMAEVSGGMVLQHSNTGALKDRIVDWTSAYYEVGFHGSGRRFADSPRVAVEVTRPGVEVWAPKWAKTRRGYRQLDDKEKRFLITELVLHGPGAQAVQEVTTTDFFRLDGRFGGKAEEGERTLTFAARWPEVLRFRALELYSVVLAPGEGLLDARLVSYDSGTFSPSAASSTLGVTVPDEGRYVWGIVAVDAASGGIYLRRMMVEEQAAESPAVAPGR